MVSTDDPHGQRYAEQQYQQGQSAYSDGRKAVSAAGDVGADDQQQGQLGKGLSRCLCFQVEQRSLPQQAAEHHGQPPRGLTTMTQQTPGSCPKVSSSTTEPHSSRSVSGRITGESRVVQQDDGQA